MKCTIILSTLLTAFIVTSATGVEPDPGFQPLFNGKDLSGWKRVNTDERTWSFDNGMLVCSGKPIGEIRTTRMYQNFIMEVEWRHMKPKGNAGIFIWADDITAKGQPFHRGIEVQVLENAYGNTRGYTTHGDIFPIHGAKMTPINGRGGGRAFPTENRSNPSPEWNHYRIEANNGNVSLAVNGKVVTRGTECNPRKGYICIESEGGIVHYRNMHIKELPATPIDPFMIAIADRGYRCLYTGIDLKGWTTESPENWKASDWRLSFKVKPESTAEPLVSEESLGDIGFVFDVNTGKEPAMIDVGLRGGDVLWTIRNTDPTLSGAWAKKGWNRFEGTLRGAQLAATLNGQAIEVSTSGERKGQGSGPLSLKPSTSLQLSNIYVRELKGE